MLLFAFCLSTNEGKEEKCICVLWARSFQQRAHLLCLSVRAPENSYTCTRVRFCSSREFSALESIWPRRYQQMYKIDSTQHAEERDVLTNTEVKNREVYPSEREREYYYSTRRWWWFLLVSKWWFLKNNQNDFVVKEFRIIIISMMRTLIARPSFVQKDVFTNGQTSPTTLSLAGRRRSRRS